MERLNIIIRVNSRMLHRVSEDLQRFNRVGLKNLFFRIPTVKVLIRKVAKGYEFDNKPLLFNYGFVEMPLKYSQDPNALSAIKSTSEIITGYFYKTGEELHREQLEAKADGLPNYRSVLIKGVTTVELDRLFDVARNLDVYDNTQELGVGAYIVLQGYPFEGLSARIERKKTSGKIQVQLVESGMLVWLEPQNVYYSSYAQD